MTGTGVVGTVAPSLIDDVFLVLYLVVDELLFGLSQSLDWTGAALSGKIGVLGHPVRRKVLSVLAEEETTTRSELAERLVRDGSVDHEDADRLVVRLHHVHLPKLADHDYVEYDGRNGDVALWRDPDAVETLLEST